MNSNIFKLLFFFLSMLDLGNYLVCKGGSFEFYSYNISTALRFFLSAPILIVLTIASGQSLVFPARKNNGCLLCHCSTFLSLFPNNLWRETRFFRTCIDSILPICLLWLF